MFNADVNLDTVEFHLPPYIRLGMSLHKAIRYNKELVEWTLGRTLPEAKEHKVYKDDIGIRLVNIRQFKFVFEEDPISRMLRKKMLVEPEKDIYKQLKEIEVGHLAEVNIDMVHMNLDNT